MGGPEQQREEDDQGGKHDGDLRRDRAALTSVGGPGVLVAQTLPTSTRLSRSPIRGVRCALVLQAMRLVRLVRLLRVSRCARVAWLVGTAHQMTSTMTLVRWSCGVASRPAPAGHHQPKFSADVIRDMSSPLISPLDRTATRSAAKATAASVAMAYSAVAIPAS